MTRLIKLVLPIFVVTVLIASQTLDAGMIVGVTVSGPGGFASSVVIATPSPDNDNTVGASPNTIDIIKTMTETAKGPKPVTMFFPGPTYLDFTFTVANTGGTTEYFVTESVTNGSNCDWNDFHHVLGYPVDDGDPIFGPDEPFTRSIPESAGNPDVLDFDLPSLDPAPASPDFLLMAPDPDYDALWWDGFLAVGGTTTFNFSMDVPDANGFMPNDALIPGGYEFTLRQWATPEPSSALLMGVGLLCLAGRRRQS